MSKKFLIVEDDRFLSSEIRGLLQGFGIESVIVSSVQDAIKLDPRKYCGAIIDLVLPNDPKKSKISAEESRAGWKSGVLIAKRFLAKQSDFPFMLISGLDFQNLETEFTERPIVLYKGSSLKKEIIEALGRLGLIKDKMMKRSFIVHGHDEKALKDLKLFIMNELKWPKPIVLREQESGGKTIIEKFEKHAADVKCIFVLLTPDDMHKNPKMRALKRHARPNVIFELGFFYGHYGRTSRRIIVLRKGETEIPTDLSGICWVDISKGFLKAKNEILSEIKSLHL